MLCEEGFPGHNTRRIMTQQNEHSQAATARFFSSKLSGTTRSEIAFRNAIVHEIFYHYLKVQHPAPGRNTVAERNTISPTGAVQNTILERADTIFFGVITVTIFCIKPKCSEQPE